MKKIISLFARNYDTDKLVRDEIVPGAEWVLSGQGIATRKYDGTAVMVRNRNELYKRYDAKRFPTQAAPDGRTIPKVKAEKPIPAGFEPCQDPDPITGHWPGWIPVGPGPEDKWFRNAFMGAGTLEDGTYELCGPHFQGNPERLTHDQFFKHGATQLEDARIPGRRLFDTICQYLFDNPMEGIVWHHPDGSMVKIKRRDFGFDWPPNED